ncbi:GuaB3 family IMP dehydrogenase-related protein [Corynebacterium sp. TAE3-ERU12]|uniref:GuaB3 family IMP dehydrogenase-related protein n=1 Tax=Corynebacterium sp. TAE3-ERU12 TaxID=2849491 RepID=UPI001C46C381|nr:GuaB3 family IMP dehydrogenase-related protein [Corynebacterium sp. TAE3-ERU12]MBV7294731.1 GuaB3 family IMP dehydrogenase-related protein [Corynebacterium sp. TAE3-ERU12]
MRDVVEIGHGREARRTYGLEDVAIIPSRRTRSSKDVDTSWRIDAYTMDIPVMTHPTDAVVGPDSAIEFGRLGGLAVLNAEGLWARHEDVPAKIEEVIDAATELDSNRGANAVLQQLHSAPIDEELLVRRIKEIRDGGGVSAVRVSPQRARELTPAITAAGAEILIIQGTLISAQHVAGDGEPLDLKDFIGSLEMPVIVGGVVDYRTALHMMRTGAAGVIVGTGPTTTPEALGIEVPMATAIADAAAARRDYLDETGGRYVHVIADGDFQTAGDVAKAIACGADAVALSEPLAMAAEAPGKGWTWPSAAAHPQFPRGVVEPTESALLEEQDRPSMASLLFGPSTEAFGTSNIVGGLKRSMAKCGFTDVKSFQKVDLSVR